MRNRRTVLPADKAAAYVRMSTEHQQFSTCNQMDVIHSFARQRNLEVVKVYSDEGKSGLQIKGRAALSQMIGDVLTKEVNFGHILVYDVSRWGRFQDPDEAAHYEYICREAGVAVHYCAEQFENDGGLTSIIAKSFKRAMAGEYSRELSVKVFHGACRLIRAGFRQGGSPGIGLRRMLVDQNGRHKTILHPGEQKSIQTDRVIIVPGPQEEIKTVNWIYDLFITERKHEREIAKILNEGGFPTDTGHSWYWERVRAILTNEKYIGNNIYHRRSGKLKNKRQPNPPEKWIRADGVFPAIVDPKKFLQARDILLERRRRYQREVILERLGALHQQHGYLTAMLINQAPDLPGSVYIARHFGGLMAAYSQIRFKSRVTYSHTPLTRRLNTARMNLVSELTRQIAALGAVARWEQKGRLLHINEELHIYVVFVRSNVTYLGSLRWSVKLRPELQADMTLIVRMDARNEAIRDYYLLPRLDSPSLTIEVAEYNGLHLDAYRFQSLDFLLTLTVRIPLAKNYERRDQNDSHRTDSNLKPAAS